MIAIKSRVLMQVMTAIAGFRLLGLTATQKLVYYVCFPCSSALFTCSWESTQRQSPLFVIQTKTDNSNVCTSFSCLTHVQLGEYTKAVECYSAAIRVEPNNSFAHYNRGITKDKLSDFLGAIKVGTRVMHGQLLRGFRIAGSMATKCVALRIKAVRYPGGGQGGGTGHARAIPMRSIAGSMTTECVALPY